MGLPPQIIFRSAKVIDSDDDGSCLGGYHTQYEIKDSIINIVILSVQDTTTEPLPEEEQLLDKWYGAAIVSDDEDGPPPVQDLDRLDQIADEIQEWVENKCESTLLELLSSIESTAEGNETTLKTYLNPSIINLQLRTLDGDVAVMRHEGVPPWPKDLHLGQPLGLEIQLPIEAEVPKYDASEIIFVDKKHAIPIVTFKHQDIKLRCKLNMTAQSTLREFKIYRDLSGKNAVRGLRVPTFYGYVTDGDESKALALLIEDIPVQFATLDHAMGRFANTDAIETNILQAEVALSPPLAAPVTVQKAAIPSIGRRRKWARQIRQTMQILHENDIIWGDVKPANIVIDVNDDAWALDFGGGFTRPWKYPADADTMLGDLSALHLIEQYLETGIEPLIPEESCRRVGDVDGTLTICGELRPPE